MTFSTSNPIPMDRIKSRPTALHYIIITIFCFTHKTHTHYRCKCMMPWRVSETEISVLCQPRNVTSHRKHTTLIPVKCQLLSVCGHVFLHMRIHDTSVCLRPPDKHTEKLQKQRKWERERERMLAKGSLLFYWLHVQARLTAACIFKKSRLSAGTPGPPVTAADRMTISFTVLC